MLASARARPKSAVDSAQNWQFVAQTLFGNILASSGQFRRTLAELGHTWRTHGELRTPREGYISKRPAGQERQVALAQSFVEVARNIIGRMGELRLCRNCVMFVFLFLVVALPSR